MTYLDLSGTWNCACMGESRAVELPGTLDENGIGARDTGGKAWHPDAGTNDALLDPDGRIATRLTRKHTYEGAAVFSRELVWHAPEGKRVFVECERSRKLFLRVNGADVPPVCPDTVSTPHVFEATGLLTGRDLFEFTCDNSYPDWPRESIVYSSAATDETQTNWNGLLGFLRLRVENPIFISSVRVYPKGRTLDVAVEISADRPWSGTLAVSCDALAEAASASARGGGGMETVWLRALALRGDVRRWDEEDGALYALTACLGGERKTVRFGVRDFAARDGRLTLNGRNIFLRGEANCAVFPQTGHPPMDAAAWRDMLLRYRSYGVNCVRFHSHCPPEAAFDAADELGMLMQPELSHWNPRDAFSSAESRAYYREELAQLLRVLANHPSFVMLTLGNELHADEAGHAAMADLLSEARALDPTRLYANASNAHYGMRGCDPYSDFYTSGNFYDLPLRATNANMLGWLNQRYPDAPVDYAQTIAAIRQRSAQPVFSFEVGQYEVLPDFDELPLFTGVTVPDNLSRVRDEVERRGLLPGWKRCVEATGELALLCYRAEIEAALMTEGLSGISLLGLQDFPGQGTALVGMMNSHMLPKPHDFARPERFATFFAGVLPLALLGHRTYLNTQTLSVPLRMANYGKRTLRGRAAWSLTGGGVSLGGQLEETLAPCGGLTDIGTVRAELNGVREPARLVLTVRLDGYENRYDIWVYPDERIECPENVYECRVFNERAKAVLASGGAVYLAPDSTAEALPNSIQAQFSTDFWSVGTFPGQAGGMGQLIDATHPIFASFPTDAHTDWQWWPMAGRRAAILPGRYEAIVEVMDSYAYLRPMAQLLECRCGGGRLLFSTLGLHEMGAYPEARALQNAIYRYLGSDEFEPRQEVGVEVFDNLILTQHA